MNPNPTVSPPTSPEKHRVRPSMSWKVPLLILGFLLLFGVGLGAGYLLWGITLSQNRAELENVKTQLETLKGSVPESTEAAADATGEAKQVTRYDITEDDDPSLG